MASISGYPPKKKRETSLINFVPFSEPPGKQNTGNCLRFDPDETFWCFYTIAVIKGSVISHDKDS